MNIHQDKYHNKSSVKVWILKDKQDRLVKSAFTKAEFSHTEQANLQPLILKNSHNYITLLYPAAGSFCSLKAWQNVMHRQLMLINRLIKTVNRCW
ncbi:hypothetical protein MOVS_04165 [Moraxella ovis]|uniref:Uncharacterized protein n=1 Tax=Moraxella ovis TaxID=29433 RepID=A0ABM6BCS2_9GAMM|nr:hypothetical protein [Moraxella ovis]ANB91309.1 hypothetical protein MOVS_04165 [Moraxella ovis]